jgi:hydroxypyruvate isomerase
MTRPQHETTWELTRRQMLRTAVGASAVGAVALAGTAFAAERPAKLRPAKLAQPAPGPARLKGRIKHSVVPWCFEPYWKLDELCQIAKKLGCVSVELAQPDQWPTLKKHGLQCAIAPSHLFVQGMNNPRYQAGCIEMLRQRIDQSVDFGCPTVITFTGYAEDTGEWNKGENPDLAKLPPNRPAIAPDEGLKNCVAGFKKIIGYAEQKKINLAIEILNTRVSDHPMKGHPGYQGNHVDYCMEIVKQVGSPRLGVLFDIYHVQIMDGDVIRHARQCGEAIKHVHTAGNPGRNELDQTQEINFRPIMKALVELGYQGYVGHEFIPTRDPLKGLAEAIQACDV